MLDPVMPTYSRLPITLTHGQGPWVWDTQQRQYLDALSGIAVCGLGHAHPSITRAVSEQAATLVHTSNLYQIPQQQQLAERLCQASGMDNVFFANSGAEANECAIKIARRYGHQRGIQQPKIVVMQQAFHGRTLATLTATANPKAKEGFGPLVEGFIRVPFDDIPALQALSQRDDVVAVLLEPVQGEGGIHIPAPDYLPQVQQLCQANHLLLMLDEIQSGMARSGRMFALQHHDFTPDVMTLAKGLANGVPIGACLARGHAGQLLQPGSHGSTFGGNPLACAAALATLEVIETQALCDRAAELGEVIVSSLRAALGDHPLVREIRHLGLLIGIELTQPCTELVQAGIDQGILLNVTAERVIRLLPPLILNEVEADTLIQHVVTLVEQLGQPAADISA